MPNHELGVQLKDVSGDSASLGQLLILLPVLHHRQQGIIVHYERTGKLLGSRSPSSQSLSGSSPKFVEANMCQRAGLSSVASKLRSSTFALGQYLSIP